MKVRTTIVCSKTSIVPASISWQGMCKTGHGPEAPSFAGNDLGSYPLSKDGKLVVRHLGNRSSISMRGKNQNSQKPQIKIDLAPNQKESNYHDQSSDEPQTSVACSVTERG